MGAPRKHVKKAPKRRTPRRRTGERPRALVVAAARATAVRDVMTAEVACVTPELSLEALTALFVEGNISGAPVVNENGRPIGMVSKTDLVEERHLDGETRFEVIETDPRRITEQSRCCVRDIMMPLAFVLRETDSVQQAAALMATENIHHVPIVGDDGTVVGILSAFDLARWIAGR